jgi:hypothetical protein
MNSHLHVSFGSLLFEWIREINFTPLEAVFLPPAGLAIVRRIENGAT